jgi:methylmalonyl-CoA mutase N-terminal domain/subunit
MTGMSQRCLDYRAPVSVALTTVQGEYNNILRITLQVIARDLGTTMAELLNGL